MIGLGSDKKWNIHTAFLFKTFVLTNIYLLIFYENSPIPPDVLFILPLNGLCGGQTGGDDFQTIVGNICAAHTLTSKRKHGIVKQKYSGCYQGCCQPIIKLLTLRVTVCKKHSSSLFIMLFAIGFTWNFQ